MFSLRARTILEGLLLACLFFFLSPSVSPNTWKSSIGQGAGSSFLFYCQHDNSPFVSFLCVNRLSVDPEKKFDDQ